MIKMINRDVELIHICGYIDGYERNRHHVLTYTSSTGDQVGVFKALNGDGYDAICITDKYNGKLYDTGYEHYPLCSVAKYLDELGLLKEQLTKAVKFMQDTCGGESKTLFKAFGVEIDQLYKLCREGVLESVKGANKDVWFYMRRNGFSPRKGETIKASSLHPTIKEGEVIGKVSRVERNVCYYETPNGESGSFIWNVSSTLAWSENNVFHLWSFYK